jgi:hypothetical protein
VADDNNGGNGNDDNGSKLESRTTANIVRVGLGVVGLVIVGIAIWLAAIRAPKPSSKTATYTGATAVPTEITVTESRPSDTTLTALLALGGVLLVAGAVYPRISSIKGPGFEVDLADLAPAAKRAVKKHARELAEAEGRPDEADAIAQEAERMLLEPFVTARYAVLPTARTPYSTTYGLGPPTVTLTSIDNAVQAAFDKVVAESEPEAGEGQQQ